MEKTLPLEEQSIYQVYLESQEAKTYMIPVYQRNYAWEEDEITVLMKDVYDSFRKNPKNTYYIGTSDFELEPFNNFYFSRTRKSLEHFYPQAKAGDGRYLSSNDINCFGNFAMISAEANSSGSNWDPKTKLDHYSDRKADQVSVGSLKFKIMMQICQDNHKARLNGEIDRKTGMEWNADDMQAHQRKVLDLIIRDAL